ncbi:MAG: HEAT repeat domain-containing protein, partial [Pirellulales bacterium]|nr:HEAT repeat domain-containing protein [Pirellulales bacterium]
LENEDDGIGRVLACDALAKRKTKANVAALRKALNDDSFYGVRLAAAEALRKIGSEEAVNALVESTDQPDARVRHRVIEQLGACYRDEARETLLETVEKERNPAIVAAAVKSLGLYRGKDVSAAMQKALSADSHADEAAAAAFLAIRDLKDAGLADDLMKTIKARDQEMSPQDITEGMVTLAKISQRGRRRDAAFDFLTGYLSHPRQVLRGAAVRAFGELREPAARPVLEPIAADERDEYLAGLAKAALATLDKETQLVPAEVGELRREVRDLRKEQEKLEQAMKELKGKRAAAKGSGDD